MNKAPDTRNRLDSNKGLNKRTITSKKKKSTYRASFQEFKEETKAINSPIKLKGEKKPTKGQLFKKEKGYSKTMKRLLHKHHVSGENTLEKLNNYKKIRKARKKAETKIRQEKHKASVLYKRTNKKTKGSSGSKPASKTKSK